MNMCYYISFFSTNRLKIVEKCIKYLMGCWKIKCLSQNENNGIELLHVDSQQYTCFHFIELKSTPFGSS